jgi:hypothetical protein
MCDSLIFFKKTVLFLILFLPCLLSYGEKKDTLYFTNGSIRVGKVIEITGFDISYRTSDTLSEKTLKTVDANEVRLIVYSTGIVHIVSLRKLQPVNDPGMFAKGMSDARVHYTNGGGYMAVGLTSFLTGGIIGLIPAVACSTTRPKYINLGLPADAPVQNKDYLLGYTARAKKMKAKKIWVSYFVGIAGAVIAVELTKR